MASNVVFSRLRNHLIGTGMAMAGWVSFSYIPNTFGVKYAKRLIETYSPYCKSISAEPETEALLNEVIQDINANHVKPVKKDGIEILQTNMLFPSFFHKGNSSTGAIIGLTIGTRRNAEDVFHYHCPSELSLEMAEFCLLSKEAKKYIFARQIFYVEDDYVMFRCLLGLGVIAIGSGLHYLWNRALDSLKEMKLKLKMIDAKDKTKSIEEFIQALKAKALRQRFLTFLMVGIVCIQVYGFANNSCNWMLEQRADEKVANLGPEYRTGGLEFYRKVLAGNKYNHIRFGDECGCDMDGNKIQGKYQVLNKHIPLTVRARFFESVVSQDKTAPNVDSAAC